MTAQKLLVVNVVFPAKAGRKGKIPTQNPMVCLHLKDFRIEMIPMPVTGENIHPLAIGKNGKIAAFIIQQQAASLAFNPKSAVTDVLCKHKIAPFLR